MTNLEQSFRDVLEAHNLHSLSVNLLIPNDKRGMGWSIHVQRWDNDEPIDCWTGSGGTIQEALTAALTAIPYTFALADEALPIGEAA